MEVGDDVRTKKGIIGKIKAIDNQTELEDLYLVKRRWYYKEDIIKSSLNIIDLIEVGDYVDRLRVVDKEEDYIVVETFDERIIIYKQDTIKSIVTKEQFERMEYKCTN